ncbi:MAG: hypothetical protein ABSC05_22670, partial [Candidatus Solibacter sp.]
GLATNQVARKFPVTPFLHLNSSQGCSITGERCVQFRRVHVRGSMNEADAIGMSAWLDRIEILVHDSLPLRWHTIFPFLARVWPLRL